MLVSALNNVAIHVLLITKFAHKIKLKSFKFFLLIALSHQVFFYMFLISFFFSFLKSPYYQSMQENFN